MQERYIRSIPALSEKECGLLMGKTVAIVGCGGLGGYLAEFCARLGVGRIRLIDGDAFEESNLNRQLLSTADNLGQGKAGAATARIGSINPEVRAESCPVFLNEENAAGLIAGADLVLDGLDNSRSRKLLAAACREAGLPYIYGAVSGWTAQAALIMPGERLLDVLYPQEQPPADTSILGFTAALCASVQCALGVKLLCGREVKSSVLYCHDLLNHEAEQIEIKDRAKGRLR